MYKQSNTIFALSSAPGKAGVSVLRISGGKSLSILNALAQSDEASFPEERKLHYVRLVSARSRDIIDNAMVVFFKGPKSFTGEDVVEIHCHGSIAIIKMLYSELLALGLRIAEAGEFARRAFLNGKFDLTSAEGLADLIEAETVAQAKQALNQAGGALEKLYNKWRESLLKTISLLEAYIDFPDEDIPEEVLDGVSSTKNEIINTIKRHLNDSCKGEILRNGIKLSIVGAPNVGKSTLLNYLLGREASIVSDIAGTTRDIVEGHLDIGGYPIIIQDTAGIRSDSLDLIENEGIKRAINAAGQADIKIIMFDASNKGDIDQALLDIIDDNSIIIMNKIDIADDSSHLDRFRHFKLAQLKNVVNISLAEDQGLEALTEKIASLAEDLVGNIDDPRITRERHRHSLQEALEHLERANMYDNDLVLVAEDIRLSMRAISYITGNITVDEILGEIFSNFCIGK